MRKAMTKRAAKAQVQPESGGSAASITPAPGAGMAPGMGGGGMGFGGMGGGGFRQ